VTLPGPDGARAIGEVTFADGEREIERTFEVR
jgi:hypothetical protein